jgi:AcrR family transcriptional regulator
MAKSAPRRKAEASAPADRRTAILSAATRRFADAGFEATTVRQIADDVNLLSGSLYHHFETKEEMLHEIVREAAVKLAQNAGRIACAEADAELRLAALIVLELGELTRDREVYAILFNERRMFRTREEFAYVLQAKVDTYAAWRTVLEDGIAAGLFRSSLDPHLTVSTIIRMLNNAAGWWADEVLSAEPRAQFGRHTLDDVTDFHLAFILAAVRTPARAAEPVPRAQCEELAKFQG